MALSKPTKRGGGRPIWVWVKNRYSEWLARVFWKQTPAVHILVDDIRGAKQNYCISGDFPLNHNEQKCKTMISWWLHFDPHAFHVESNPPGQPLRAAPLASGGSAPGQLTIIIIMMIIVIVIINHPTGGFL